MKYKIKKHHQMKQQTNLKVEYKNILQEIIFMLIGNIQEKLVVTSKQLLLINKN